VKFSAANFLAVWRRHVRLVLILTLCGLGAAGVLGVLSLRWFQHRELTGIIRHEVETTANGLDRFLAPITSGLDLLVELGRKGFLDLEDKGRLDRLLAVLTRHIPNVSQAVIASSDGRIHEYTPAGYAQNPGDIVPPDGKAPADLAQRLWYKGAMETQTPEQAYVTPSYIFSTLGIRGVTASRRYRLEGTEHPTFVVALKVSLADLRALVREIGIGEESRIFVTPEGEEPQDFIAQVDGSSASALATGLEMDAAMVVRAENGPLRVRTKRGIWWVGARQSAAAKARTSVALAVPERVLLERTGVTFHVLLGGYLLILGAVASVAVILSRRSGGRALESLSARPSHKDDSEDETKTLIRSGEDDTLEFKSTLRWNLRTNRADKGIELACLKTMVAFMNTEGGTLLVGVTDDGAISGIAADNFPNEDKFLLHFNNLVKEHIGLEFSELISFGLKRIDNQSILVVDCGRSSAPVFLRHGSEEEFYVRVGPGSRKLPTSKVLDYVRTR
jgi:hypothetical protein